MHKAANRPPFFAPVADHRNGGMLIIERHEKETRRSKDPLGDGSR